MKLFRTNKMSFEGLKLSIVLYRLDKGNIRNFYRKHQKFLQHYRICKNNTLRPHD